MGAGGVPPDGEDLAALLATGELDVVGRISGSSNVTLLATCRAGADAVRCVYKPVRGERPLHDFPDGTLAGREVAASLVSRAAGWGVVPTTVLRDGPLGPGSVQRWVHPPRDAPLDEEAAADGVVEPADGALAGAAPEQDDAEDDERLLGEPGAGLVDVVAQGGTPRGWHGVLDAWGPYGEPVTLVHADDPRLLSVAVFDAVANNADRKAGHLLLGRPEAADPASAAGRGDGPPVHGIDHGLVLHAEGKLRTVLWGWAGDPLPDVELEALERLRGALRGGLEEALRPLLTAREVRALRTRVERLLRGAVMPQPPEHRSAVPWPVF
ncbi:SCO1664 family protein [uncultured Pseudokineococcus sp.]|uniref:SCO1664 family protein n=1 Tax=uncultured Pseudokineococcus sp. TaxID=1642928 RepID=UPI002617AA39|nr:SCO1664 family protein [uncultured Pseudokineococcus sp.]